MALRINTNISAINAQRQLGVSNLALSKSLERLSSGKRINRAADDAAGLAISETLKSQVLGLNQATANAQDSINLIQTAEGGLEATTTMLHRMRELAVQASSDTYTQADRAKIQEEMSQLQDELTRVASTTQFNGRNLIDGSIAQSRAQITASASIKSNARVGGGTSWGDLLASVTITQPATAATDAAVQFQLVASTVNSASVDLVVTGSSGYYSIITNISSLNNQTRTFTVGTSGVSVTFGSVAASVVNVGSTALVQAHGVQAAVTTDNSLSFHIGTNEGQIIKTGFQDMRASALKLEGLTVVGTTDADSRVKAQNFIGVVDEAMKTVNTQRARMGAVQNRLEHTISNLQVSAENLTASESRIRDVDVARESSQLTRTQILMQAGTAMLAQANSVSSNALSLLR